MIKLTTVKIKANDTLRGAMAEKKLDDSVLNIPHIVITAEKVQVYVHTKMMEALEGIMNQMAAFAEEQGVNPERVLAAMENNINNFNLDAGSGYTAVRKVELIDEGILSEEDFIAPKTGGKSVGKKEVAGSLDLF